MRLGLLGGTFDPVHYGHLLLAELAHEQCALDEVWLLPAAQSPHKRHRQPAAAEHRLEMLKLAIAGNEHLRVSGIEVERGGISYTVDTLRKLKADDEQRELFFLLGADSLDDLPNWREPQAICQLALPVVVRRPGSPEPHFARLADVVSQERLEAIRTHQVQMPLLDLSSTELRRRVAEGRTIRYQTPRAVEKYIETAGLYRQSE